MDTASSGLGCTLLTALHLAVCQAISLFLCMCSCNQSTAITGRIICSLTYPSGSCCTMPCSGPSSCSAPSIVLYFKLREWNEGTGGGWPAMSAAAAGLPGFAGAAALADAAAAGASEGGGCSGCSCCCRGLDVARSLKLQ